MAEQYKPFDVGYKRPPKSGQFAKGQSGNPKGRPKGSPNVASMFLKIARERIRINMNGRTKTITKLEAVMLQLMNKAVSGDQRAAKDVLNLHSLLERVEESKANTEATPDESDKEVMGRLLKRIREAETHVETEETAIDPEKSDE
jgi:hypothetical protein